MLACAAVAACSSNAMETLQPFQTPSWTTTPSDDDLVRAIVGTGGSPEARADAERIARDLLISPLRSRQDVQAVRRVLGDLRRRYDDERRAEPHEAFLRVALAESASMLSRQAGHLAEVRLHHDLWPNEPFPQDWQFSAGIDPATLPHAAAALAARLDELTVRYISRAPWVFGDQPPPLGSAELPTNRTLEIARNHIHVALTGDYSRTADVIHSVLVARGVPTFPIPVGQSY